MIYQHEDAAPEPGTADWDRLVDAHLAFQAEVRRGPSRVLSRAALLPASTATTVRDGLVTDGPFAEAREVLGGFYVVEADDLDEALRLARLVPAGLAVEVRPLAPIP